MKVCCLILFQYDKILVCKRSANKSNGGLWEFPGGKIKPHETEEECIIREIKEELNILIHPAFRLNTFTTGQIQLIPIIASSYKGDLELLEHDDVSFLLPNELPNLNWSLADLPIVQYILENLNEVKRRL